MKHVAIITKRPERSGSASIPDGGITGNGDLAVVLGICPAGMRVFLSKTDVWHAVEREPEGGRLASSGLSGGKNVPALQQGGNGLNLNGRRSRVAHLGYSI